MIRVGIVDDHPAIRDALTGRAATEGDIVVIATAGDLAGGRILVARDDLDVLIVDVDLGAGAGGLSLLPGPADGPAIVILSALTAPAIVRAARDRGAAAYVAKSADLDELVGAIRAAATGASWFGPAAVRAMRSALRPPSWREAEVMGLVLGGASNDEIGARLGLGTKTVESHLRRLFDRYSVASRTELAVLALRQGWLRLDGTPGEGLPPRTGEAPRP